MKAIASFLSAAALSCTLLSSVPASAVPFQMLVELEPQAGNTLFLNEYGSLAEVIAATPMVTPTAHNFQTSANARGFAFDGNQYHMLVEVDPQFGNELFVLSYDTLADVIAGNHTTTLTAHNFQTSADARGFTFDGNQYHMLVEVEPAFGNELYVLSYDTLADVFAGNHTTTLTAHNFQTSADARGFTFDGTQYHMLVEVEPAFGNELYVLSYDTLADVFAGNHTTTLTAHNLPFLSDAAGFNALLEDEFIGVPAPASWLLFGIGCCFVLLYAAGGSVGGGSIGGVGTGGSSRGGGSSGSSPGCGGGSIGGIGRGGTSAGGSSRGSSSGCGGGSIGGIGTGGSSWGGSSGGSSPGCGGGSGGGFGTWAYLWCCIMSSSRGFRVSLGGRTTSYNERV